MQQGSDQPNDMPKDDMTTGGPVWPAEEPSARHANPVQYPQGQHAEQTYPAMPRPSYPPMRQTAAMPGSPGPAPAARSGRGKLMAGVTVLALLVGGAAGGVGGYLVADGQGSDSGGAVNALDEDRPAKQTADSPDGTVAAAAEKAAPSVVQLEVQTAQGAGEGSGFVLTSDGYVMTNNHVVEGATDGSGEVTAIFPDGQRGKATVIGRNPTTDIAVVKVDGVDGLTPAELGRSDDLKIGQDVVAIGSPFELDGTVTAGIISSLQRPVTAGGGGGQSTAMDAIQTDAAINPGNSGGPLIDLSGRVIGINSAIYSPNSGQGSSAGNVGIGFAIPIDQARRTANEIIDTGKATQTYIGANVNDAENGGARIVEVLDGSPAKDAGLKSGDVVVKFGDRAIDDATELVAAVRTRAAGEKVTFTVEGGRTVEVTLGAQPVDGN